MALTYTLRVVTVHGVSWERAPGDWFCHVRGNLGSGGCGEELGDGKAGHARGADPGQVGEEVEAVHPAGRRDRQHDTGEPCATPGLRAETPLAPQDGRPDRRPMPDCCSVNLGEILGDLHAVMRQVAVPVPPPLPPTRSLGCLASTAHLSLLVVTPAASSPLPRVAMSTPLNTAMKRERITTYGCAG